MLFTSFEFAIFLIVVFISYWFVFNKKLLAQNILLLVASYVFYGWWGWRFLLLLSLISVSNYILAIKIEKENRKPLRNIIFFTGLLINVGALAIFKYLNFFIEGFIHLTSIFGLKTNLHTLNIVLPIGISFYIFLCLSYIIDVYRHKLAPVRDPFAALLAFSLFPIILAGPIHRPMSLLPQIQARRQFDYAQATDGLRQILWGLFMKIVIADRCAVAVNPIFADSSTLPGSTLVFGIFLFSVQIYADFAGYSNIAIGAGKLLGFTLVQNFAYPYFSRNIREFWKRWNMSLTSWFRDYVFLPITYSVSRKIRAEKIMLIKTDLVIYAIGLFVTWILTGLWHGAAINFVAWGAIHGSFLLINHLKMKPRKRFLKHINIRNNSSLLIAVETIATFIIVMFSWIFFRTSSLGSAMRYISGVFSPTLFTIPAMDRVLLFLILFFFVLEWLGRDQEYAIARLGLKRRRPLRWILYYALTFSILYSMRIEPQQFIYFSF